MSEDTDRTRRTRRRVLQSISGLAIAGLAGCSGSTETAPQSGTSTPTTTDGDTPPKQDTRSQTAAADKTVGQTSTEASASVEFLQNPEDVHSTLVEETSVASDEVLIGFRLEDSSLPFTTEVYHAPDDAEIQATKTYDSQDLSQVDLVPEPPRELATVETDAEDVHYGTTTVGEPLKVTLVARHDGETFDWSSWDRTGYPVDGHDEDDPAVEVDCYCGGMIYTAPGEGTWARVIQVTPTERVESGTTVALNWTSSRVDAFE